MGNSEVGHLNLGAGRPVLQDLPRIDAAIADGSFFDAAGAPRGLRPGARRTRRPRTSSASSGRAASTPTTATSSRSPSWPRARASPPVAHPRPARRPRHAAVVGARLRRRTSRPRLAAAHPGARDRDRRRPLLRDGPRPPLGAGRDAATTRSSTARRRTTRRSADRGHRGGLRPRRDRRVRQPDRRSTAPPRRCRPGDPIVHRQLPRRPGAPADPRAGRRPGVRRLRPHLAERPAGAGRPARRDDDRVRGGPAVAGRVPARDRALARPGR